MTYLSHVMFSIYTIPGLLWKRQDEWLRPDIRYVQNLLFFTEKIQTTYDIVIENRLW